MSNPLRLNVHAGKGQQTFVTAHVIQKVQQQQRHHTYNSVLDGGIGHGGGLYQAREGAVGELTSRQLQVKASVAQIQPSRSTSHQIS